MKSQKERRMANLSKGYSLIGMGLLVLIVSSIFIGIHIFIGSTDSTKPLDSSEDQVKKRHQFQNSLSRPKNFDKMPAFIQAMPKDPKDRDSDMNGLRDDVQVFIAYKYPNQPELRSGLIQFSKAIIDLTLVRDTDRLGHVAKTSHHFDKAKLCISELGINVSEFQSVKGVILNTDSRLDSFQKAIKRGSQLPNDYELLMPETVCDILQTENEIALQKWSPSY